MKAIIQYGPFSTMIDVTGDGKPIYFPKPEAADMPYSFSYQDDVVKAHMTHKMVFTYRTSIDWNGQEVDAMPNGGSCALLLIR